MGTIAQVSLVVIYSALGALWPQLMRSACASQVAERRVAQFIIYAWIICVQVAQHYLATVGLDLSFFDTRVHINSYWIFPLGLISVLYAFIAYSPKTFRRMLRAIVLANLAMATVICCQNQGWVSVIPDSWSQFHENGAASILTVGTLLLVPDITIMIWLYLVIHKRTSSIFLSIWAPLLVSLLVDAAGFSWVVAYRRKADYLPVLSDQLWAKLISGTVYAVWFSLCSQRSDVSPIIMTQVGALRRFFSEALPILHKVLRHLVLTFPLLATLLTWLVESGNKLPLMREHGKDAARSGPEKQEPGRANQVPSARQTFADGVGGSARHGINQSIIKHGYTVGDSAFPKADVGIDPALLLSYTGQWIAWSPDGRNVVAHDKDPVILEKLLESLGLDMSQCVLDYIDEGTEI